MSITCCIHHTDNDGKLAAAIVNFRKNQNEEIIFLTHNYGDFDYEYVINIIKPDKIVLVDISFPPDKIKYLIENTNYLEWYDHHKTALENAWGEGLIPNKDHIHIGTLKYKFHLDTSECGAKLAYHYYNSDFGCYDKNEAVELVDIHDRWLTKDPKWLQATYFSTYSRSVEDIGPESKFWRQLLENKFYECDIKYYCEEGKKIYDYISQTNKYTAKNWSYECDWLDHHWLVINDSGTSLLLESIYNPEIHDGIIMYKHTNTNQWKVSLYGNTSGKVDMSLIAKKYGGGGHFGAAGFTVNKLEGEFPWV